MSYVVTVYPAKGRVQATDDPIIRCSLSLDKTGPICAFLFVQAVNRLFEASGGSAILETAALQRFHRDVHAASHHQGINWDAAAENFGRQTLGLEPSPGPYGLA